MKLQTFGLILFIAILGEFTEPREAFKMIRPYKYYNPRPRSHKPRWQSFRGSSTHGTLKKNRSKHPHYYYRRPPSDAWREQNYPGRHAVKEPYTIVIELPRRHESSPWINDPHSRKYALGTVEDHYGDEKDYREEAEEFEDRVMQTVMNGAVRIKLAKEAKPKLKIKLSRDSGSIGHSSNEHFFEILS